ncbi:hypothetical protein GQ54DRAFT_305835 [Martensiomyces pterosporus]|nr:hypothetical protein GQ54DRAFT_305835 [Martensiomyces pterosporus]
MHIWRFCLCVPVAYRLVLVSLLLFASSERGEGERVLWWILPIPPMCLASGVCLSKALSSSVWRAYHVVPLFNSLSHLAVHRAATKGLLLLKRLAASSRLMPLCRF